MDEVAPDRTNPPTAEHRRLAVEAKREVNWKRWGTYLAERQWATVREDYSAEADPWGYFPFEHSHRRAYRWGEDGLLGWTDRECRLCFAVALWNERDPILKERLFGLTNPEGNHGEDVKELYHYLDAVPTHAYAKGLYRYPQAAYPYDELREVNARRGRDEPEYELSDTGVFDAQRCFDVWIEYAKGGADDTLMRIRVANRGPERAAVHVLPTLWFRNTWRWGCRHEGCFRKPALWLDDAGRVQADHESLGRFVFQASDGGDDGGRPTWLFTENETNNAALFGSDNFTRYVKDGFHERVIRGDDAAVNPKRQGTKAAAWYRFELGPGERRTIRCRLHREDAGPDDGDALGEPFEKIFAERIAEADAFYDAVLPAALDDERRRIARQAYAGLLWTKQFYHFIVEDWLDGDPNMPAPPASRRRHPNAEWTHLYCRDVLSMPDKWEYPWFAAWDLAFHKVPFARIDPHYAKQKLTRLLREWYLHPNGQLPAYEFNFSDVNPPVHALACWKVYEQGRAAGMPDHDFLAGAFQKLLLNFTWWVNRKDPFGRNVFAGGFLGLDNIGVFDRNRPPADGRTLIQADGSAWMAFFCVTMLRIALELAPRHQAYEDMASKFFEHFIAIVDAMNGLGGSGLWDEEAGFYYDWLGSEHELHPLRVRSLVGLIPLFAVDVFQASDFDRLPGFRKRTDWFMTYRQDLAQHISFLRCDTAPDDARYLLAVPSEARLRSVLRYLLDPDEFLSPFGVRSMSRVHEDEPYTVELDGERHTVRYEPGESTSEQFGGNSNWRGPIWLPVNWLLIESLRRYHRFYGDGFTVECPVGSGEQRTLDQVADEISTRLIRLFLRDERGGRPSTAGLPFTEAEASGVEPLLFHEFFHAETGQGLGAAHQTGWTALIATLIETEAERSSDAAG